GHWHQTFVFAYARNTKVCLDYAKYIAQLRQRPKRVTQSGASVVGFDYLSFILTPKPYSSARQEEEEECLMYNHKLECASHINACTPSQKKIPYLLAFLSL